MRLLWFNLATDTQDPILGFTCSWIRAVAGRVESVDVITMRQGLVEVPENARVYSVGKERGLSEIQRARLFYHHLQRILRGGRVDACFSHMIPVFTILAAPICKARGVPIVTWHAHPSRSLRLKLAHWASDRMVSSLASAYPYRHDKLVVLGQGIDTDLFSPGPGALPDTPPVVLCAGRLSPVKDHQTLLEAARLLRQRRREPFRVVIVGGPAAPRDEPYVRSLHQQVQRLELQETIQFVPPMSMPELATWFRRCTVHVNLTGAGFGDKVALEAMSCGKLCLVANEGFEETLGRHAADLLFRGGCPAHLAARLDWALSLPREARASLGSYLRQQVISQHSLQHLSERLVGLLRDLRPAGDPSRRQMSPSGAETPPG